MENFNLKQDACSKCITYTDGSGPTGFGNFLVHLKIVLTGEHIRMLMTAFEFKPAERDKVDGSKDPGYDFVHLLREKGIISETDISALIKTLEVYGLRGVAEDVDKSFKRFYEANSEAKELPQYKQDGLSSKTGQMKLFRTTSDTHDGTELDNAKSRQEVFMEIRTKFRIQNKGKEKLTVVDGMIVRPSHFTGEEDCDVLHSFLGKLASYDYRVQQLSFSSREDTKTPEEMSMSCNWIDFASLSTKSESKCNGFSSRDIMYVIFFSLDPFLRQDVLTKMASCQLAVPLLLLDVTRSEVTMLLWGLRKITKSWCDDPKTSLIREEVVVKVPFMSIAALRIGKFPASKSNILNKFLGPAQNNDEHAFFTSFEQDSFPTVLSEGTLECAWFLPGNEEGPITSPFVLLNLRGDSVKYTSQAKFAKELSSVVMLFIDSALIKTYQSRIEEIASHSYVVVVIYQKDHTEERKESKTFPTFKYPFTLVFSGGMSALEIGREISKVVQIAIKEFASMKQLSLENAVEVAKNLEFKVDEDDEACSAAKELAMMVKGEIKKNNPQQFKQRYFRMQKFWKTWSSNDRRRSWTTSGDVEHDKALHEDLQAKIRSEQADVNLGDLLKSICNFLLKANASKRHYLLSWLQTYLNEEAVTYLKPLIRELTQKSSVRRNLSNQIHQLESDIRNQKGMSTDQNKVQELKQKEKDINFEEGTLIRRFDENVLGLEHFIREFGQLVESYHYSSRQTNANAAYIRGLPTVVAQMLLEGYPLEILDGDTSHVPVMWLKAVFRELAAMVSVNAKIFVMSVLGIQSSGKSTLLNSMFGVRFATSAGRCTRGVFLQVLPVEKPLAQKLQCDFIAIVDTEGLRAPEKTLSSFTEQDNELATFALCISDLTLINIGGQTMGEDMMNVLQIAAHAFVRMKEVNLRPQCRIVQQFVADVTAEQKNESAMQTIIMKLDEAACEAARREGKEQIYRQFSDIFTLQNYESHMKNVQYIPSLWRGFMAAPDYQYSVRVQKLKSAILQSIATNDRTGLTFLEFQQRINDVWNAMLKEDFVFSFQNTKEVSLYQEVMLFYRANIQPIRQEILEMELSAKNAIARAKSNAIDVSVDNWLLKINSKLASACSSVSEVIESKFNEKRYLVVKKYSGYFQADLKTFEANIKHSIATTIRRNAELTKSEHKKFSVAEEMKKDIHDSFAQFAQELRSKIGRKLERGNAMESTDEIIENAFKKKWAEMMESVRVAHPLKTLQETHKEIKSTVIHQIIQDVWHTELSKDCTELLKCDMSTYSTTFGELGNQDMRELKLLFSNIANEKNELFRKFVSKVRDLAKDHKNFQINAVKTLHLLKLELQTKFLDSNCNVLLLYMCSLFITESHKSQQKEELRLILNNKAVMKHVCAQEKIVPKNLIPSILTKVIFEEFSTSDESKRKVMRELQHESNAVNFDKIEKDPALHRFLKFIKQETSTPDWFYEYFERLKKLLVHLEEENGGKLCTEKLMKSYVESAKQWVGERSLSTKRQLLDAIKVSYKVGIERFTEAFDKCFERHVMENTYVLKHAEPHEFPCLQTKVTWMTKKIEETFSHAEILKPPLSLENIRQFSALPPVFSVLRKVDPCLVNMIPPITSEDMYSVVEVISEVKNSILSHAKPNTDFNTGSFVKHIGELIQNTDKFSKQIQVPAIVHTAAWALPIYAKCQYDYEKKKNLSFLIEKEEKVFQTEFRSLSSICQDELIAELWFELIENAILDGIIDKFYPMLYSSSLNMNDEFRTKTGFVGSVLKDLFKHKNYQGIADLLSNFQSFSQNWILDFHAKQFSADPSLLESKLTSCFDNLIEASKQSIQKTANSFEGKKFSEWIVLFTSYFEKTTKLSCDQNKVETIRKYLKVSDFRLLSKCCLDQLDAFKNNADLSDHLPDVFDVETIKAWIMDVLPKPLHVDILESFQGCNAQCPFCGTICDHNLTEHPRHESISHFPSGLNGWRDKYTKKLSINICNSNVESKRRYEVPVTEDQYRPYREYEVDFPDWKIRGQSEGEPTKFWKRIFVLFNNSLAEKYDCKEGDIPPAWSLITDEEAMQSLCAAYNL